MKKIAFYQPRLDIPFAQMLAKHFGRKKDKITKKNLKNKKYTLAGSSNIV